MPRRVGTLSVEEITRQLVELDTALEEVRADLDSLRSGDLAFTGNIDLGGYRVTNLGTAESEDDALTLLELSDRLNDIEEEETQLESTEAEEGGGGSAKARRLARRTSRLRRLVDEQAQELLDGLTDTGVVFAVDDGAGGIELKTDSTNFSWNDTTNILSVNVVNVSSAGAEATPSFYLAGDTTTGFWRPGADILGLSVAGAEALRLSATELTVNDDQDDRDVRIATPGTIDAFFVDSSLNQISFFGQTTLSVMLINPTDVVFNEGGSTDVDVRAETNNLDRGFVVDASADAVGMGGTISLLLCPFIVYGFPTPQVVINEPGLSTTNFRVEGDTQTSLLGTLAATDQIVLDGVAYNFPAADAAGVLTSDGASNLSWAATAPAAPHALLSATHSDTVANAVTRGSLIYGNVTPAWDELVLGASGTYLRSDGTDVAWTGLTLADATNQGTTTTVLHGNAAGAVSFGAVVLTTDVSGVLPEANGGTNQSGYTAGDLLYASALNTLAVLGIGGANTVLVSNGTIPGWQAQSAIDHGSLGGLGDDDHTIYLLADGTRALTAAWDAGSWQIRAETFQSDIATGTAPLTVASTTVVSNLNVDQVDGRDEGEFALLAGRAGGQTLYGGTATSDDLDLGANNNAFAFANTGRINIHERLVINETFTNSSGGNQQHNYLTLQGTHTFTAATALIDCTIKAEQVIAYGTGQVISFSPTFWCDTTIQPTAAVTDVLSNHMGFFSRPFLQPSNSSGTAAITKLIGIECFPRTGHTGAGGAATLDVLIGTGAWVADLLGAQFTSGTTISEMVGVKISTPSTTNLPASIITDFIGVDIAPRQTSRFSGITLSLRSTDSALSMRHAGPAVFGENAAVGTNEIVRIIQTDSAGAIPALLLDQADVDEPFFKVVGDAAAATLTRNIVAEADVTTATRQGFIKIEVQDDGNQITDQDYYIPVYTLA